MNYKNIYLIIISLYIYLHPIYTQKALLLSSSLGYYNIRQINNIIKIYQHLRENGYKD